MDTDFNYSVRNGIRGAIVQLLTFIEKSLSNSKLRAEIAEVLKGLAVDLRVWLVRLNGIGR